MLKYIKLDNIPEGLKIATRWYHTVGNLQALIEHQYGEQITELEKGPVYVFSDMPDNSEGSTLEDFISKGTDTIAFVYRLNETEVNKLWAKFERDKDLIKSLINKQSNSKSD